MIVSGYVIYDGPSMIDGERIVAIVTGLTGSRNTKTGKMVQTYIIRPDMSPLEAVRKGKDVSHVKALSSGGSNANGVTLQSPSENRSYKRKSNHKPASALDIPKGKRKIKV